MLKFLGVASVVAVVITDAVLTKKAMNKFRTENPAEYERLQTLCLAGVEIGKQVAEILDKIPDRGLAAVISRVVKEQFHHAKAATESAGTPPPPLFVPDA